MACMGSSNGDSGKATQPSLREGATALCFVALCAHFCACWSLNSHLFPLYDTQLSTVREICTLVAGAALVGIALIARRRPRMINATLLMGIACAGAAIGLALVWAGVRSGSLGSLMAGACLRSVAEGACVVLLGAALCVIRAQRMLPCIVLAAAASEAVRAFLPTGYADGLLVMHGLFLFVEAVCSFPLARSIIRRLQTQESPHDAAITQPQSFLPLGHQLFICLLLFRIVYGFMLTFGETGGIPARSAWSLCALVAVLAFALALPGRVTADALFKTAMLCSIAGLLLVPASGAVRFEVSNGLISCGVAISEVFIWAVLAALARRNVSAAVPVFAWGMALNSFGVVAGANLGRFVNSRWTEDVQTVIVVTALFVFCLVLYLVLVMPGFSFSRTVAEVRESAPPVVPQGSDDPIAQRTIEDKCDDLARMRQLTGRETEVLKLLARGRSGVFIQNELVVSYNTVKAHVKHIYQKLDVHTHQELIDLVEMQK